MSCPHGGVQAVASGDAWALDLLPSICWFLTPHACVTAPFVTVDDEFKPRVSKRKWEEEEEEARRKRGGAPAGPVASTAATAGAGAAAATPAGAATQPSDLRSLISAMQAPPAAAAAPKPAPAAAPAAKAQPVQAPPSAAAASKPAAPAAPVNAAVQQQKKQAPPPPPPAAAKASAPAAAVQQQRPATGSAAGPSGAGASAAGAPPPAAGATTGPRDAAPAAQAAVRAPPRQPPQPAAAASPAANGSSAAPGEAPAAKAAGQAAANDSQPVATAAAPAATATPAAAEAAQQPASAFAPENMQICVASNFGLHGTLPKISEHSLCLPAPATCFFSPVHPSGYCKVVVDAASPNRALSPRTGNISVDLSKVFKATLPEDRTVLAPQVFGVSSGEASPGSNGAGLQGKDAARQMMLDEAMQSVRVRGRRRNKKKVSAPVGSRAPSRHRQCSVKKGVDLGWCDHRSLASQVEVARIRGLEDEDAKKKATRRLKARAGQPLLLKNTLINQMNVCAAACCLRASATLLA